MEAFTYTYWFIIKDMTKDTDEQTIEVVQSIENGLPSPLGIPLS